MVPRVSVPLRPPFGSAFAALARASVSASACPSRLVLSTTLQSPTLPGRPKNERLLPRVQCCSGIFCEPPRFRLAVLACICPTCCICTSTPYPDVLVPSFLSCTPSKSACQRASLPESSSTKPAKHARPHDDQGAACHGSARVLFCVECPICERVLCAFSVHLRRPPPPPLPSHPFPHLLSRVLV